MPSRAVIRDSWHKSLTYSISTSPNGINVLTSICHTAGLGIANFFRKIPRGSVESILGPGRNEDMQVLAGYMGTEGADTQEIHALGDDLAAKRRLRAEFRTRAFGSNVSGKSPIDAIKEVVGGTDAAVHRKFANALMPDYRQASLNYKPHHVLKWAMGQSVAYAENPFGELKYRATASAGGPQLYDHAWIVVKEPSIENCEIQFKGLSHDLKHVTKGVTPVSLFDYHDAGIRDTLVMLETAEAKRLCTEMPRLSPRENPKIAFCDERNSIPNKESQNVFLRDFEDASGRHSAHDGDIVDCRVSGDAMHPSTIGIHEPLDRIVNRGRLPALQPYTSTCIVNSPPIRRMRNSGIEINSVCAYEHTAMVMEASIHCSKISGLKDHQERFQSGSGLEGLKSNNHGGLPDAATGNPTTKLLPFSNDIVQINWTVDAAKRQFIGSAHEHLKAFNEHVELHNLGPKIELKDMPQQPLPCSGYPTLINIKPAPTDPSAPKTMKVPEQLLSLPIETTPSSKPIEVSTASEKATLTDQELFNRVGTAIGRRPNPADIATFRKNLIGDEYMNEVVGDLNDYDTWSDHVRASMLARGFGAPENDPGMLSLLDAELMLWPRMVERLAEKKGTVESTYNLKPPWPQTYSALERNSDGVSNAEVIQKKSKRPNKETGSQAAFNKAMYAAVKKPRAGPSRVERGCGNSSSSDALMAIASCGFEDARND